MTQIKVTVTGSMATAQATAPMTCGMVGLPVMFSFDRSWDTLQKTAVFRAGGLTVDCVGLKEKTTVPPQIMEKQGCALFVGVYGVNQDGSLVIPTVWAEAGTIQPGADPSGDESTDPALPVWQNTVNAIGELSQLETKDKSNLVAAVNEVYGKAGQTAGQINDGVLSADKAWSSRRIVDKCCPAFTQSGSVVTCEPVEGYPLQVVSQIITPQLGSGDPSPENIRPIDGFSEVNLWHGGKNLLPDGWKDWSNYDANGNYAFTLPPGRYIISGGFDTSKERYVYLQKSVDGGGTWATSGIGINSTSGYICGGTTSGNVVFDVTDDPNEKWSIWTRQGDLQYIEYLQIKAGSASTAYEPYRGEEFTADFYELREGGGSYNWNTGVLTLSMVRFTLTGVENWNPLGTAWQSTDKFGCYATALELPAPQFLSKPSQSELPCSHCVPGNWGWGSATESGLLLLSNRIIYLSFSSTALGITDSDDDTQKMEKFKSYLAGQYSAGTPVEFCYTPTTEPVILEFEPQEIPALSGVNTLYSDRGETTVTGRADPTAVIEKLTNAILAFGGNV